jgi:hypothetical protein
MLIPPGEVAPKPLKIGQKASLEARRKRYRARLRAGRMVLPLEVDPPVLELFIRERIATESQVAGARSQLGKRVLGQAISAWFRRSAG